MKSEIIRKELDIRVIQVVRNKYRQIDSKILQKIQFH